MYRTILRCFSFVLFFQNAHVIVMASEQLFLEYSRENGTLERSRLPGALVFVTMQLCSLGRLLKQRVPTLNWLNVQGRFPLGGIRQLDKAPEALVTPSNRMLIRFENLDLFQCSVSESGWFLKICAELLYLFWRFSDVRFKQTTRPPCGNKNQPTWNIYCFENYTDFVL